MLEFPQYVGAQQLPQGRIRKPNALTDAVHYLRQRTLARGYKRIHPYVGLSREGTGIEEVDGSESENTKESERLPRKDSGMLPRKQFDGEATTREGKSHLAPFRRGLSTVHRLASVAEPETEEEEMEEIFEDPFASEGLRMIVPTMSGRYHGEIISEILESPEWDVGEDSESDAGGDSASDAGGNSASDAGGDSDVDEGEDSESNDENERQDDRSSGDGIEDAAGETGDGAYFRNLDLDDHIAFEVNGDGENKKGEPQPIETTGLMAGTRDETNATRQTTHAGFRKGSKPAMSLLMNASSILQAGPSMMFTDADGEPTTLSGEGGLQRTATAFRLSSMGQAVKDAVNPVHARWKKACHALILTSKSVLNMRAPETAVVMKKEEDGEMYTAGEGVGAHSSPPETLTDNIRRILLQSRRRRHGRDLDALCKYISKFYVFQKFSPRVRRDLCRLGVYERYGRGRIIIRQGHPPRSFYIILNGSVDIYKEQMDETGKPFGQIIRKLCAGDGFGEFGLHQDQPRAASAVCSTDSELMRISKDDFNAVAKAAAEAELNEKIGFMAEMPLFRTFGAAELRKLAELSTLKEYPPNCCVLKEGEVSDNISFVVSGVAKALKLVHFVRTQLSKHKFSLRPYRYPICDQKQANSCPNGGVGSQEFKEGVATSASLGPNERIFSILLTCGQLESGQFFGEGNLLTVSRRQALSAVFQRSGGSHGVSIVSCGGKLEVVQVGKLEFLRVASDKAVAAMRGYSPCYDVAELGEVYFSCRVWGVYKKRVVQRVVEDKRRREQEKLARVLLGDTRIAYVKG